MSGPLVPGGIGEHTSCLLVKLGQVAFRLAEDWLHGLGLRVRHYSVLQALADNGPMSQLSLGSYLRIDPATMVSSLDDLESLGLAARARDPEDRRRYVVDLSDAGRETLRKANTVLADLDRHVLSDLPQRSHDSLHKLLAKMNEGAVLPGEFDRMRDQTGSTKMSSASSPSPR
ncbi:MULTISPECIES: MarR family winged helix-turn-helix transcriptional regulator [Amycolatopsis]|uniref:MarR family winged helix-turn-helix transcriptional regulator n=1 Tax=Amycolatopsis sp. cg13 TaxID=3238807 RepID=UPI0035238DA2